MANNFKRPGKTQKVTAAAARTVGAIMREDNWNGIVNVTAASGAEYILNVEDVWNVTVPSGTSKGDILYITGAMVLTETRVGNRIWGRASTDRNATTGKADVKIVQTTINTVEA